MTTSERPIALLIFIGIFVTLLALGIWWQTYAFKDCKKVGHSTFYCIMRIGR